MAALRALSLASRRRVYEFLSDHIVFTVKIHSQGLSVSLKLRRHNGKPFL